jgi:hypothetical protein
MRFILGLIVGALFALSGHHREIIFNAEAWTVNPLTRLLPGTALPPETAAPEPRIAVTATASVPETEPEPIAEVLPDLGPSQTPDVALPESTPLRQEPVTVEPAPKFQVAWTRFRSEASARGFANRLEEELGVAFDTVRVSAGNYEVGFYYREKTQRDETLSALEAFTGYRVSQAL